MVGMMKQSSGKIDVREFNKAIAEYQVMNDVNQDIQREFNEGFEGMETNDDNVDDFLKDM